jgi:Tol biopolymer transport system component
MSWFPDGRHLVLVGPSSNFKGGELFVLDIVNGSRRVIHTAINPVLNPSVSPDGTRIAFAAGWGGWDVVEISLTSSSIRKMASAAGLAMFPDWAPSGTHFLFSSNAYSVPAIEDRSPTQGFARRLVEGALGQYVDQPRWAPDGIRFVFRTFVESWDKGRLMLSNAAGGPQVSIDPEAELSGGASWSPDGRWIAYLRMKQGARQIVKISPGSTTPVILANGTAPIMDYYTTTQWSPSNEWILYPTAEGFSLISPDGKSARTLSSRKFLAYGFSKDGSRVLGMLRNPASESVEWQLFWINVKTGAEQLLAPLDLPGSIDNLAGFSLHPDGKRFLTSMDNWSSDIWMLEGFDQQRTWLDRLLRQ